MTNKKERRSESRSNPSIRFTPVSCSLVIGKEKTPIEIVNYHYRGACLKVSKDDYRVQTSDAHFIFKIGSKELPEKILYRIVWETIHENGLFGVEFATESSYVLARAERFSTHSINAPVVSAQDPLDPNRILYMKVVNASATGMLLATSLTNKHLFPGMELRTAILDIPGIGKTDVDLFIENSRPGAEIDKTILYGVSVKGMSHNYNTLMAKYLSNLGGTDLKEERLKKLNESNFLQKNLRSHLTIREVKTEDEYKDVLKLRYVGYSRVGKVAATKSWHEMGDGLEKEGIILAAYLGGQIIASCEFRFSKSHGLRLSQQLNLESIPEIRSDNLAEVNKLVVHPDAQSSDVVLGIFQKIHALSMLNGRPDGIILAEPKLIALYERLGFKRTSATIPHPIKTNTTLTVMIIYKEAYTASEGMNPYAWSIAFEHTQNFLDEIGIHKNQKFKLSQKIVKTLTPVLLRFSKKKKSASKDSNSNIQEIKADKSRTIADPKWTKQHLNATVFLPYVLESNSLIGLEMTNKILLEYGLNLDYFRSISNWISIDFFDDFIENFSKYGDPYLLNRKAGFRSVTKEILGSNYFIVKHFFSPRTAFKTFERFLPKFNKTRTYKVIASGPNFCRIKISQEDRTLLPKHPSAKENWFAVTEAYILTLTGKPAKIQSLRSSFDGDPYCEFIVSWTNPFFSFKSVVFVALILLFGLSGGTFAVHHFGYENCVKYTILFSIPLLGAFYFWRSRNYRKKYYDMMDSIAEIEHHADERYRELQSSKSILEKSYQEGKLLETLNREIQNSEDLSKIFEIALNAICTKFDLKRAFIMIADESFKTLRTASAFGADAAIEELWKFQVDISVKRESPLVLSSVFHSGQSILIQNVEEHVFHLNDSSRRLIERLNTKGFAIVPIPGENRSWGVIVADKGQIANVISRRDLVALQRISQSIGLALDKKAKIESEIQIRKIFQKYVPSTVIESTLGSKEPKLGGQAKDSTCLFLDIRNFTTLSSQVPPEILCEILNKIFDLLQKCISDSHGVIDKFLGDGALVTWGAIPGSEATPQEILQCAQNFLSQLDQLNKDIQNKGLNKIEVGIGIHSGKVIAGNIGSQERMEFTVIGSTVNLASRLEQLSKVFKCHIVISENFIAFEKLNSDWKIVHDVQVRGLSDAIKIATYCFEPKPTKTKQSESA